MYSVVLCRYINMLYTYIVYIHKYYMKLDTSCSTDVVGQKLKIKNIKINNIIITSKRNKKKNEFNPNMYKQIRVDKLSKHLKYTTKNWAKEKISLFPGYFSINYS